MKNGREEINVFLFKNNCFQCFGFPVSLEANNDNNNDEDEFGCKKNGPKPRAFCHFMQFLKKYM